MDRTAAYYSSPTYTFGAGMMPVFSGSRRQRGGSIFGAIKSFLMPVLSAFGRKVVKRGASEAVGLAKDIASEAFSSGKLSAAPVKSIAKKRALNLGKFATTEGLDSLQKMIGSGRRRARRRKSLRKRNLSKRRSKSKRPTKKRRRTRHRRRKSKANF